VSARENLVLGDSVSQPADGEEWTLQLLSSQCTRDGQEDEPAKADRTLELRFILPSAYPAAPPQVKARLLSEKLSAKAVEDHGDSPLAGERATELVVVVEEEEGNEESPQSAQENESITALLQEQANKGATVSQLLEIARQWLDVYTERLREKLKQELDRRAQEKKIQEAQAKTVCLSPAIPEMSNFQKWLVRVGIKKPDRPKLRDLADIDDAFLAELAEKRKANPKRGRRIETLHLLCIKVVAESLLRYESLEGVPQFIREDILKCFLYDFRLLYPDHLRLLLCEEFESLDLSCLPTIRNKHLQIISAKSPRVKELNIANAKKLRKVGLESIANCHQLTHLVVDDCSNLEDFSMTAIIEGCPLLTDFSARRCLSITSTTLHSLGRRCNNLSTLVIAGCTNIALDGLITVSRMARRLQVIDASEVANSHSSNYFDCIKPNRLSNQWLSSITLDGCMFVTKQFLRELLGPLKGQVCPNLTALSLRDCPKIVDGFLERLILPMCPNLQALHYSAETKRSLISKVDLNGLSFFQGCRYAFPARSSRLPPLVQRLQRVLTQEVSSISFPEYR